MASAGQMGHASAWPPQTRPACAGVHRDPHANGHRSEAAVTHPGGELRAGYVSHFRTVPPGASKPLAILRPVPGEAEPAVVPPEIATGSSRSPTGWLIPGSLRVRSRLPLTG